MYSWSRRWEPWQMFPAVLSLIIYLVLMSLPAPIGLILRELFPGWFVTYTPSTLLKGLFIKDRRKKLHWATTGRYTSRFISDIYDCTLILMAAISFIGGWYSAVTNAVTYLNEIQSALALLVSGNFYGFFMGIVASKDREIYTGLFG